MKAAQFLLFFSIVVFPSECTHHHAWKPSMVGSSFKMRCQRNFVDQVLNTETGQLEPQCGKCNQWLNWRSVGGFVAKLPVGITPENLVRILFWFSQKLSLKQISTFAGIPPKTTRKVVKLIRTTMTEYMQTLNTAEKLGGDGRVVCIDETYVTKRKRNRAGFAGRLTAGHTACLLGGVELELSTRRCTGRTFLVQITGPTRANIERVIRQRVQAGSRIWTDGHKSYKWMGMPNATFQWDSVIHSKRQFAKYDSNGLLISTNAVEGLFGRLKKYFRQIGISKISRAHYYEYMGEFMWRERFLSARVLGTCEWRPQAFFRLADLIGSEHIQHVHETLQLPNGPYYGLEQDVADYILHLLDQYCPEPPPQPAIMIRPLGSANAFPGQLRANTGVCIDLESDSEGPAEPPAQRPRIEVASPSIGPPSAEPEPDLEMNVGIPPLPDGVLPPSIARAARAVPIGVPMIQPTALPKLAPKAKATPSGRFPPWVSGLQIDTHYWVKYEGGGRPGTYRELVYRKLLFGGEPKLQFLCLASGKPKSYFVKDISEIEPMSGRGASSSAA